MANDPPDIEAELAAAEAVAHSARLTRIANRMIEGMASDPEYQAGDAVVVMLDREAVAAGGAYDGYRGDSEVASALSQHLLAAAERAGFRVMLLPVAGG